MRLKEARDLLNRVEGRNTWWIREYGLSLVREAIWTIRDRKSSTQDDLAQANAVEFALSRD